MKLQKTLKLAAKFAQKLSILGTKVQQLRQNLADVITEAWSQLQILEDAIRYEDERRQLHDEPEYEEAQEEYEVPSVLIRFRDLRQGQEVVAKELAEMKHILDSNDYVKMYHYIHDQLIKPGGIITNYTSIDFFVPFVMFKKETGEKKNRVMTLQEFAVGWDEAKGLK